MDLMLSSTDIRLKIPGEEASSICTPSALAIFLIDMVDPMPQEKNTTTFPPGLSPRKPSEFSLPNPPQQASVNSIGWLAKTVGEMWPVTRVSMSFHEFPISHRVYTYHKFSLAHTHTHLWRLTSKWVNGSAPSNRLLSQAAGVDRSHGDPHGSQHVQLIVPALSCQYHRQRSNPINGKN